MALLKNNPTPKQSAPAPTAKVAAKTMAQLMHARVVVPAKQTKRGK